jgi:hypothetical protein
MKMLLLLLPLCLMAFQSAGDAARQDISTYQYVSQVNEANPSPKLGSLELTLDVLSKLQSGTNDLRLYDSKYKEIPYYLDILDGDKVAKSVAAQEISRARKAGQFSELIVQIPQAPQAISSIQLSTTSKNYRFDVTVDGSNDLKEWLQVGAKLSIFDYTESQHYEKTSLELPRTQYRYYRIHVFDGKDKPFEFVNAKFSLVETGKIELIEVPADITAWQVNPKDKTSTADVHLHAGTLPLSALTIETGTKEFIRSIEIVKRKGGKDDDAYAMPYGAWQFYQRTGLPAGEGLTNYFQNPLVLSDFTLRIRNEDNPPLENVSVKFYVYKHLLYFPGGWAPPLRLYVGKPAAAAPSYEFATFFRPNDAAQAAQASLSSVLPNAEYKAPAVPLVQRVADNPLLLYSAYGLALLTLVLLVFQALKKVPSKPE